MRASLPLLTLALAALLGGAPAPESPPAAHGDVSSLEHSTLERAPGHVSPVLAEGSAGAAPQAGGDRTSVVPWNRPSRRLAPAGSLRRSTVRAPVAPTRGRHPGFLAHPATAPPHEA